MGMMSDCEAYNKGICAFCEKPMRGRLPATSEEFLLWCKDKLCAECYQTANGQQVELDLPEDNILYFYPYRMGTMITFNSRLLTGCRIDVIEKNGIQKFIVTTPNTESCVNIRKHLKGLRE